MDSILRQTIPVLVILLVVIALEQASPRTRVPVRERFPGLIYLPALPILVLWAAWPLSFLWHQLGVHSVVSLRGLHPVIGIFVALLLLDFLRYLEHRLEHRFWWRVHSLHHAQSNVHAASIYAHPLIALPEFLVLSVPLSLIDIGVTGYVYIGMAVVFQDFVIHSPLRVHLGPLRRIFVDNRFHRIHHSLESRHFGKNFGLMFTIWDQLFGTAHFPAKDEWPETGVEGMKSPQTISDILVHPFRSRSIENPERDRPDRAPVSGVRPDLHQLR